MHRDKSKLIAVALVVTLVAAIGLVPAFAKSTHGGKGKITAGRTTHGVYAQRVRALNAYGSVNRSPTFSAPNPNSPALTGGGSPGYNANLYVY